MAFAAVLLGGPPGSSFRLRGENRLLAADRAPLSDIVSDLAPGSGAPSASRYVRDRR